MMPFALNDATRFISPTKTLEYIAGGKPVVSTAVRDVVVPYGERGIVQIADQDGFAAAIDHALIEPAADRAAAYRDALRSTSWDQTWQQMSALIAKKESRTVDPAAILGAAACTII